MLLKLTHQTDLSYSDPVTESIVELRMAPRQEGGQHRLSFMLAIGPNAQVSSYFDWLGNTVHGFTVGGAHSHIRIVATSVVETDRPALDLLGVRDAYPIVTDGNYSFYDYLQFGGPVVDSPLLREIVGQINPRPGSRLGQITLRMLDIINTQFTYKKGITTSASPITEALQLRAGVCQDFTHLFIGMARAMGMPARYVSGLLHSPSERYRGATQSHAWCEVYFPSAGWVAVDPTNNCVIGENFVKVAVGRDYRDVPPNKGMYRGTAKETIDVSVRSEELTQIPSEMFAERFQPLSVAMSQRHPALIHRALTGQQQEVQQQQ